MKRKKSRPTTLARAEARLMAWKLRTARNEGRLLAPPGTLQ